MNKYLSGNFTNPNRFLFFAIVSSAIVLILAGTHAYNVMEDVLKNSKHAQIERSYVNDIRFFDEVLTNSALLAATTGDGQWEKRYRIFEPKLDNVIKNLIRLDTLNNLHKMLKLTDNANVSLVAMENRVFELVRDRKLNEAVTIMTGREYARQKAIYSEGLSAFIKLHELETDQLQTRLHNKAKHSKWFFGLVILLLAIVWLPFERFLGKSRAQILQQNQELELQIRARKESESAIFKSKEQYRLLVESAPDIIFTIANDSTFTSLNPAFETLIFWQPEEWIGKPFAGLIHPDDLPLLLNLFQRAMQGEVPSVFESRVLTKQGNYLFFEFLIKLVWENGAIKGIMGITRHITERKQMEEKLRHSEQQFRLVWEKAADGMRLINEQGTVLMVNEAYCRFVEKEQSELLGKSFAVIYEQEQQEDFVRKHQERFKSRMVETHYERELILWNGRRVWIEVTSSFLELEEQPSILLSIFRDITKRKQAEEALEESEEKYRILAETSPEMIYLIDTKGYVSYVNKVAAAQFRAPAQELIGKHLKDIFPPDLAQQNLANIQNVIATKNKYQSEVEMVFPTGSIWIDARLTPVFNEKGDVTGVLGLSYDITERKRAEEELAREHYLMNMLMDSLPDHIYFKDNASRFIRINNATAKFFGLNDSDQAVGKTDFDFFTTVSAQQSYEDEQTIIRTGQMLSTDEKETYHDRPDTWVSTIKMPLFDKEGKIIGTFGISRDITEKKLIQEEIKLKNEQLQKLNAEKDKFFSIIAHDLRSPFSGFLGLTQIMAEELSSLTMAQVQELAISMENSATNLYSLLENLLQWARMQQGLIPFNPEVVQIHKIAAESIAIMVEPAKNKGIDITYNIPENIQVFADINMLQTMIRNLVSNAVKFTHKGGKISLSAKTTADKSVEISITDSGIGMSNEMVKNLFRLDVQTNRKGTEGESSTGLGLLLCNEFVEKHGGKLWVESEEGKGSTFYFTIPFED